MPQTRWFAAFLIWKEIYSFIDKYSSEKSLDIRYRKDYIINIKIKQVIN